jgi:signal transduction histidine kinase
LDRIGGQLESGGRGETAQAPAARRSRFRDDAAFERIGGLQDEAAQTLVAAVQQLAMARDLADVQAIVRRAARRLTGADGATFVLREGNSCFYADEDAISPLWKGERFRLDDCISGWAMLNRSSVAIEDIYADERIPHEAYRPTFVRSLAMVPIRSEDPVGAIGNYWAARHLATDDELTLLQALADSTAVAMENVRVWGELEQRVRDRTAELEERTGALEETNAAIQEMLELETERATDLRASAEQRRRIINTLAHEVRNPLTGGQLLLEQLRARDGKLADDLATVQGAVEEALRIVSAQLEQARSEAGGVRVRIEPTRAEDVLAPLRGIAHPLRRSDAVEVRLQIAGPMPELHTDGHLLGQILRNLLGNALKFTDSGEIDLCASYDDDTGVATFEVSDTGIGIPAEDQERVFEEFGQVGAAQQGRLPGTGLGLPLCRSLATELGGTLELESEPGEGSTFTLRIPTSAP